MSRCFEDVHLSVFLICIFVVIIFLPISACHFIVLLMVQPEAEILQPVHTCMDMSLWCYTSTTSRAVYLMQRTNRDYVFISQLPYKMTAVLCNMSYVLIGHKIFLCIPWLCHVQIIVILYYLVSLQNDYISCSWYRIHLHELLLDPLMQSIFHLFFAICIGFRSNIVSTSKFCFLSTKLLIILLLLIFLIFFKFTLLARNLRSSSSFFPIQPRINLNSMGSRAFRNIK